jgi:hypothetical protein
MNDFFKNLIQRSMGTAPIVQPMIRPRFTAGVTTAHEFTSYAATPGTDELAASPSQDETPFRAFQPPVPGVDGSPPAGQEGHKGMHQEPGYEEATPPGESVTRRHTQYHVPPLRDQGRYAQDQAIQGKRIPRLVSPGNIPEDKVSGTSGHRPGELWRDTGQYPDGQETPVIEDALNLSGSIQSQRAGTRSRVTPGIRDTSRSTRPADSDAGKNIPAETVPRRLREAGSPDGVRILPIMPGTFPDNAVSQQPEKWTQARASERSLPFEPLPPSTRIQVTIGRVEVRAISPLDQPVPPVKTIRRKEPVITLDKYLKGRSGGK